MTNEELLIGFINYLKPHIPPTLQENARKFAVNYLSYMEWKVGEKVMITERLNGHRFSIGSVVEIVEVEGVSFYCDEGKGKRRWWITKDEGIRL